jgi:PBP1b-binding outer membrane lipoprotein LpoB
MWLPRKPLSYFNTKTMKFTLSIIALFVLIISLSSCSADEIEPRKPTNENLFEQTIDSTSLSTTSEVDPPNPNQPPKPL